MVETTAEELPRDVLKAEIAQITRLGGRWEMQNRIGPDESFDKLTNSFDAVLIACGSTALNKPAHGICKPRPGD